MSLLKKSRVLVSDVTEDRYRVTSNMVAEGGFGEVFEGVALDGLHAGEKVAVKATDDAVPWHGEAYFGRLLDQHPDVVQLYDAFPVVDGRGAARMVKYLLVFDWMEEGTVADALARQGRPWPEDQVVDQLACLLGVLELLHRRGICHGDITPRNVYVRKGKLLLGDLGLAKQGLHAGRIRMSGAAPDAFLPPDGTLFLWSPSDDVYQVGLLAHSLLAGQEITSYDLSGRTLKRLRAGDAVKGWIRDACSPAGDRFHDAHEALGFLTGEPIRPARAPRSLRGQCVVFTGTLPVRRADAQAQAKAAGASVQGKVNGATTLIVAGQPNPLQIGQTHGTKLFDAHRRIRRGQPIAIIDSQRFERLAAR